MAMMQLAQASSITVNVAPWLAPNAYGSPSFTAAQANAVQAMEQGLTAYGTPGTPTYFHEQTTVTTAQAVVTGFPSWLGRVDPGTVFGPAFANELGNRMTFALAINGNGTQFSISQLGFAMTSTDPANGLDYAYGAGLYGYSDAYVGVLFGPDGVLGGGDDTYITSGSNTQLVDALFGRGSGNSFAAYCSPCTLAQQQAQIDAVAAYPGTPFDFTGTYTLYGAAGAALASGSGTFNVLPTPEPGTMPLAFAGLLVFAAFARHRRKAS